MFLPPLNINGYVSSLIRLPPRPTLQRTKHVRCEFKYKETYVSFLCLSSARAASELQVQSNFKSESKALCLIGRLTT